MPRNEIQYFIYYNFEGLPDEKKSWLLNPFIKFLWFLFSCIIGLLLVILIIIFYFFFGCAYEFINCYLDKNYCKDDEDYDSSNDIEQNQIQTIKECTAFNATMCILIGLIGILLQPIYLVFYLMFAVMKCYRDFGCCLFIISNNLQHYNH